MNNQHRKYVQIEPIGAFKAYPLDQFKTPPSLAAFVANGTFEEKSVLLRFFGEAYQDYMRRVTARYFTRQQANVLVIFLALNIAGLFFA